MSDRLLDIIERKGAHCGNRECWGRDDGQVCDECWLIGEVSRLRGALEGAIDRLVSLRPVGGRHTHAELSEADAFIGRLRAALGETGD